MNKLENTKKKNNLSPNHINQTDHQEDVLQTMLSWSQHHIKLVIRFALDFWQSKEDEDED